MIEIVTDRDSLTAEALRERIRCAVYVLRHHCRYSFQNETKMLMAMDILDGAPPEEKEHAED